MNAVFKIVVAVVVALNLALPAHAQYGQVGIPAPTPMPTPVGGSMPVESRIGPPPFVGHTDNGPVYGSVPPPPEPLFVEQTETFVPQEFQGSYGSENSCRASWKNFSVKSTTERDLALEKAMLCREDRESDAKAYTRVLKGERFENFIAQNEKDFRSLADELNLDTSALIGNEALKQWSDIMVTEDKSVVIKRNSFLDSHGRFCSAIKKFFEGTDSDFKLFQASLGRISKMYQADVAKIEAAYAKYLAGN